MSDSQKRVAWAFVFGIVLVSGAFVMSNKSNAAKNAALAIAPNIERNYIDVADADGNKVPDWQDSLFGKDDVITISTTTATYTKPTTVTGKFAINFFENVINSKLFGVFGDSKEEVVQKSTENLLKEGQDELFAATDITSIDNTDQATLRSYGNQVASILLSQKTEGEDELAILSDALRYDDMEKLKELEPIVSAYGEMVTNMTSVSVPETYVTAHLDLLNALNAVYEDVRAMQNADTDPMYTFLRMKRYEDDVLGLSNALSVLFDTLYLQDKVRWSEGEATLRLVTFTQ
jgi:hypothetical protein